MESDRMRTVIKLGGSLFESPSWPNRLRAWLARQPSGDYFAIVGGGKLIDALRELDGNHPLVQSEMHWRCIRVLDATYEIATELVPEFGRLATSQQLCAALESPLNGRIVRTNWVRIGSYYSAGFETCTSDEPALEHGWNTTSDSLALLLACRIRAKRCVLLKSCEVKHLKSIQQAVSERVIDSECIRFEAVIPSVEFEQI